MDRRPHNSAATYSFLTFPTRLKPGKHYQMGKQDSWSKESVVQLRGSQACLKYKGLENFTDTSAWVSPQTHSAKTLRVGAGAGHRFCFFFSSKKKKNFKKTVRRNHKSSCRNETTALNNIVIHKLCEITAKKGLHDSAR